jgi:hypothetical protein
VANNSVAEFERALGVPRSPLALAFVRRQCAPLAKAPGTPVIIPSLNPAAGREARRPSWSFGLFKEQGPGPAVGDPASGPLATASAAIVMPHASTGAETGSAARTCTIEVGPPVSLAVIARGEYDPPTRTILHTSRTTGPSVADAADEERVTDAASRAALLRYCR